jgi:lipopolysaccharide biosynthesis glycosyltransferase
MKSLLVTSADKDYLNQAKQLFTSAFFNARWQGDFMLLTSEIPEKNLEWFRSKGIIIKKCQSLFKNYQNEKLAMWNRLYVFSEEFKKWKNIIYLDSDIIIRDSLDEISSVKGFWAAKNIPPRPMAFNDGVMAFSTDIITGGTFQEIKNILNSNKKDEILEDQAILNLYFHEKWKILSEIYNLNPYLIIPRIAETEKILNLPAVVLHFYGNYKPWDKKSFFYEEWNKNLEKADLMGFKKLADANLPKIEEIKKRHKNIAVKKLLYWPARKIDRVAGKIGYFLKCRAPMIYHFLKK